MYLHASKALEDHESEALDVFSSWFIFYLSTKQHLLSIARLPSKTSENESPGNFQIKSSKQMELSFLKAMGQWSVY